MPCSSSETGAGSNWESCCSALTAFLSAPPATSSRTEALLNSVSRTRGSRVINRGSGSGSAVLFPTFASTSSPFHDALSLSAPLSTPTRRTLSREDGEGSTHEEVARTSYSDVAPVSANPECPLTAADVVRRGGAPGLYSAVGNAAAIEHPTSMPFNGGGGLAVRPEQQGQRACHSGGVVWATTARAGAVSTTSGGPAAASPVTCAASVVSSAIPLAAAVPTASVPAASSSTAAAPTAASEISVADAGGNCESGKAGESFTPWRNWLEATQNGTVRALAEPDTTALPRASPADTTWRTMVSRGAQAGGRSVAQHTSHQLRRRRRASAAAHTHIRFSQEAESNASCETSFVAAPLAETGAVLGDGADSIDSLLAERRIHETTAAFPRSMSGVDFTAKDRTPSATASGITAEWRLNEAGGNRAAPAAGDGSALLAAAAAAAVVDSGAAATDADAETGHTVTKQVVFYSSRRLPMKGTESHATALLLPSGRQQREMALPQQSGPRVPFTLTLQPRPMLQHTESEGHGSRTTTSAMMQGHAERACAAEEPYEEVFCAVTSTGEARHTDCGRVRTTQERSVAEQPGSISLSRTIPDGSRAWEFPSGQEIAGSRMVQGCVRDDVGLLPVVPGDVRMHIKPSLLPRPESRMPDGELADVRASEGKAATDMRGTVHPTGATHAPLDANALLGDDTLTVAGALESEAMIKTKPGSSSLVCATGGATVEPTRKGHTSLTEGSFSGGGKRMGQPSRQRPFPGGDEEGSDRADRFFAGERTCALRRGRCQRPASWKRVRQTMGDGQLPCRGCDLIFPTVTHAAGACTQLQRNYFEQQQKRSGQQGSKDERSAQTAADVVEERKSALRIYEEGDGEEPQCHRSTAARGRVLQQSRLLEKANGRVKNKLVDQADADTPFTSSCDRAFVTLGGATKSAVSLQNHMNVLATRQLQGGMGPGHRGAHGPLGCAKPVRGVVKGKVPSSACAADAGLSEQQQNNLSESLVPSIALPHSDVWCGDPCVTCKGVLGVYDRTRDRDSGGRGSAVAPSPRACVLPPDERKEDVGLSITGRSLPKDLPDGSTSRQQVRRCSTCVRGADVHPEKGKYDTGSDLWVGSEPLSGTVDEDSRRRSIGPGEFDRFDDDTSSDESNASAREIGSRLSQHLSPLQMLPQQDLRTQQNCRTLSAGAGCPPSTDLSACMQAVWRPRFECSSEDVDEDEASRFFKRRRCSLLLWGGVRGDRGHTAIQHASVDAPYSAQAPADERGGAEDRHRKAIGVSATNTLQVERVGQFRETPGSASLTASHQRLDQLPLKQQPSSEGRQTGSNGEQEGTVTKPPTNAPLVAPTVRLTSDAATSPAGASAAFPSRPLRKRKRGVGAPAIRLLFLQRSGAGVSSEDVTLVNSLSSALTYEETQQLRRHEQEQRQQELLRQQEARQKEETAAARLKEQQKAAAAAVAAVVVTASPSGPYAFGSAIVATPGGGSDLHATPALPVHETADAATSVERSSAADTLVDSVTAVPLAGTGADSSNGHVRTPYSVAGEMHSTGQSVEQHQHAKEASLSGRPKLRIIRSPAAAGDLPVPPVSAAADAHESASGPCDASVVGNSTLTTSNERNTDVARPFQQQVELPIQFGGGASGWRSSQGDGLVSVTQQPQMSGGLLPAEFGGASVAPGASGAGLTGSRAFGSGNAFSVATAGVGTSGGERNNRLNESDAVLLGQTICRWGSYLLGVSALRTLTDTHPMRIFLPLSLCAYIGVCRRSFSPPLRSMI